MSRPLEDVAGVHEWVVGESPLDLLVRTAPGYKMFVGALYNGQRQWVAIDGAEELSDLVSVLEEASRYTARVTAAPVA